MADAKMNGRAMENRSTSSPSKARTVKQKTRLDTLRDLLARTPPGRIDNIGPVLELLEPCWYEFKGSGDYKMAPYKLRRMERAAWNLPKLVFVVVRHGAATMGSSRAELQRWTLDMNTLTAVAEEVGHRQVVPMQARLDVRPVADEIARLIVSRADDARLKRYDDGRVRVLIGKIIPADSAVKQTLDGRRRRFRNALTGLLENLGWCEVNANLYEPCD